MKNHGVLGLTCLLVATCSLASELPTGRFVIVNGRIMAPKRDAPSNCDVVSDLIIEASNVISISDRQYGECLQPPPSSSFRQFVMIQESVFACGITYTFGVWGQPPYVILNDYREAPKDCFRKSVDLPIPLISDLSLEIGTGSEMRQFLSLECSRCDSVH